MKLNKKEKKTIEDLEPVLLAIADLKAQLAFYEAKKSALEGLIQSIDPRKFINGRAWHNGVEVYQYRRASTSYKSVSNDLANALGFNSIPLAILEANTKQNSSIKTKLGGVGS